jgi:hypothetical protein
MRTINTNLVGQEFAFDEIDDVLHSLGFTRGGKWDYDYATYDFPLSQTKLGESVFLRIDTRPTKGRIEGRGCIVTIDEIGIIGAVYHQGVQAAVKIDRSCLTTAQAVLEQFAARYQFPIELSIETTEQSQTTDGVNMRTTA